MFCIYLFTFAADGTAAVTGLLIASSLFTWYIGNCINIDSVAVVA
jgi:hypothetical protein